MLSDFLLRASVGLDQDIFPPENITSPHDYQDAFIAAGFDPRHLDITSTARTQLVPFFARMVEYAGYLLVPDPDRTFW